MVPLSALDVSVDLFYQQKIGHVLANVGTHVWDWDDHIILPLDVDHSILSIGALAPIITHQGLGGSGELIGLEYGPHAVDVTLHVLIYSDEGQFFWPYLGWPLFSCILLPSLVSFNLWICRGRSPASVSCIRLGRHVEV